VACDRDGVPSFDRLRYRRGDGAVFLYAFDLIELNGQDLRREPLEARKRALATVLRAKAGAGIQFNEHCDDLPAEVVFRHACKLGFEGIVSKRLGSPYRSGRSRDWLKMKNPAAPAAKREAEEDWGRQMAVTPAGPSLLLKRAALSRPSGQWDDDDYDVLADGEVVGRIYKAHAAPGRLTLDVDSSLLASRGPLADARLRGDARGCDGGVR